MIGLLFFLLPTTQFHEVAPNAPGGGAQVCGENQHGEARAASIFKKIEEASCSGAINKRLVVYGFCFSLSCLSSSRAT